VLCSGSLQRYGNTFNNRQRRMFLRCILTVSAGLKSTCWLWMWSWSSNTWSTLHHYICYCCFFNICRPHGLQILSPIIFKHDSSIRYHTIQRKAAVKLATLWLYWRWSSLFNITDGSAECNGRFLSEVIVTQVQISHSLVPLHKQQPFTGHISNRIGGSKQTLSCYQ